MLLLLVIGCSLTSLTIWKVWSSRERALAGDGGACTAPAVGSSDPAQCNFGTLAPGQSGTFTMTVKVPAGTPSDQINNGNYTIGGDLTSTLLGAMLASARPADRIVTVEETFELDLAAGDVVAMQCRTPNLEGTGAITMRDLVKNCLRMRPERIIVGEVRGPEAFDLLQAMNTGHDGSMGTLHANSPREAISRMESMITMGGYGLPSKTIREMIVGSVDVIIQAARLRDGSRRITHITEVVGLEGDVIVTQDLFVYEITGEDENGKIIGRHRSTGIARPRFWDRARYYGLERELADALDAAE